MIGKMLREKREELGITQYEVSKRLGFKSSQFVSLYERGLSPVPLNVLNKCCTMFKINKQEIIKQLVANYETELRSELK